MASLHEFFSLDNALLPVIGMLAAAGAAKLGYGHWAAGTVAVFIAAKAGAAATALLTHRLSAWVARIEKQEQRALVRVHSARSLRG